MVEYGAPMQGGTGVAAQSKGASLMWMDMLKKLLSQYGGLMSGTGTPQELPWFKGFQEQLMRQGQDQDAELIKTAIARGITGNSLAQMLGQSQESRNQGILNMFNQMYQQAPQKAGELGKFAVDTHKAYKQMQLQFEQMKQQADQAESAQKMGIANMIMGGAKSVAGGIAGGLVGGAPAAAAPAATAPVAGGGFLGQGMLNVNSQLPQIDWSQFMLR